MFKQAAIQIICVYVNRNNDEYVIQFMIVIISVLNSAKVASTYVCHYVIETHDWIDLILTRRVKCRVNECIAVCVRALSVEHFFIQLIACYPQQNACILITRFLLIASYHRISRFRHAEAIINKNIDKNLLWFFCFDVSVFFLSIFPHFLTIHFKNYKKIFFFGDCVKIVKCPQFCNQFRRMCWNNCIFNWVFFCCGFHPKKIYKAERCT